MISALTGLNQSISSKSALGCPNNLSESGLRLDLERRARFQAVHQSNDEYLLQESSNVGGWGTNPPPFHPMKTRSQKAAQEKKRNVIVWNREMDTRTKIGEASHNYDAMDLAKAPPIITGQSLKKRTRIMCCHSAKGSFTRVLIQDKDTLRSQR
jgi:hypothetical protein